MARGLVRQGWPFAAHEVLEARWKAGPDDERDLWQGLAQLCVGLTHAARGNAIGADRLLDRGAARLEAYDARGGSTHGLDLARRSRAPVRRRRFRSRSLLAGAAVDALAQQVGVAECRAYSSIMCTTMSRTSTPRRARSTERAEVVSPA